MKCIHKQLLFFEVSVKHAEVFSKVHVILNQYMGEMTLISSGKAVRVALVPSHNMNGLDFQREITVGPPTLIFYGELEAADTDWCPANKH